MPERTGLPVPSESGDGFKAIALAAFQSLKELPKPHRAGALIGVLLFTLCSIGLSILAVLQQAWLVVLLVAIGSICLIVICFYLFGSRRPPDPSLDPIWSRPIIDSLSEATKKKIDANLSHLRNEVVASLHDMEVQIKSDKLRTAVFVLDQDKGEAGEAGKLLIPPSCCVNFGNAPDKGIELRPYQGITGCSYMQEEELCCIAKASPKDGESRWPAIHRLDQNQENMIHASLSWIVAVPVRTVSGEAHEDERRETLGVLCVDCIEPMYPTDEMLEAISGLANKKALTIAMLLKKHNRRRVALVIEEEVN